MPDEQVKCRCGHPLKDHTGAGSNPSWCLHKWEEDDKDRPNNALLGSYCRCTAWRPVDQEPMSRGDAIVNDYRRLHQMLDRQLLDQEDSARARRDVLRDSFQATNRTATGVVSMQRQAQRITQAQLDMMHFAVPPPLIYDTNTGKITEALSPSIEAIVQARVKAELEKRLSSTPVANTEDGRKFKTDLT